MSALAPDFSKSSVATAPKETERMLKQDLHEWCEQEIKDWDAKVMESNGVAAASKTADSDLWDSMPMVDSKTVARTSPIFEKHLDRPLDLKLIRPGGYDSIEDMIDHLVPAMMGTSQAQGGVRGGETGG